MRPSSRTKRVEAAPSRSMTDWIMRLSLPRPAARSEPRAPRRRPPRARRRPRACAAGQRAAASTSPATRASRSSVAGAAASASDSTSRPIETSASAFALLMAARPAIATSRLPASAGAATAAKSAGLGHGARWIEGCAFSAANAHDQISSVMYGRNGANRRSSTSRPRRSVASAEARPAASSPRARVFASSSVGVGEARPEEDSRRPSSTSRVLVALEVVASRAAPAPRSSATKARSSSVEIGAGRGPSARATNLLALNSFVTSRFPTLAARSRRSAVSTPSRALPAQ